MKIIKLAGIYVFLLLFISIKPNTCNSKVNTELENIAKKTLLEKYSNYKKAELITSVKKLFFLNNEISIVNIIAFGGEDHPPHFYIVIDKNKNIYIFSYAIDSNVAEFNKLVANTNSQINENNLQEFLNSFIYLINNNAKIISSYDDFEYLKDIISKNYEKKVGPINPLKFEMNKNEFIAEFFSWDLSILSKWKISFSHQGEILSFKYIDLFILN
jgi:hypothetical protein